MASQQGPGQESKPAPDQPGSLERTGEAPAARREHAAGPFSLMRRLGEQMDRMFRTALWPQIEVSHRDNKLVVTADIPGLKREDVNVEVREKELVISGERRSESEQRRPGYYRSERSYGSFKRTIPLPEGSKLETASATFDKGVLRIEIEAPTEQVTGRRIEVREGNPH